MAPELSKGKTLVVLAIVIGCFAILWPKIFYPMFQGSVAPTTTPIQPPVRTERDPAGALCCGVVFESDANSAAFLTELCSQVLHRRDQIPPDRTLALCHHELMDKCGIDLEDVVKSDVDGAVVDRRLSSKFHGRVRAQNLTRCLEINFGIDENLVRAKKSYHRPSDVFYPRHMRPERPPHLHPDVMHPALREKGRVIPPTRTIEKQAKPGPMPGMRPPMGGAGHIVSPSPGSGGMGILMPIYTIGIIVFFLYTMMKIMFKKPQEDSIPLMEPRIKDFHMDAEHRKYLFSEEYCTGVPGAVPEMTVKEYALLQEQQRLLLLQQQRRSRSKTPEVFANKDEDLQPIPEHVCHKDDVAETASSAPPAQTAEEEEELEQEEVVEEAIIPRSPKMDTHGKPIGQWYLPPGFDGNPVSESADESETGPDEPEIDLNDADERSLRLAFAALKAQKEEEVDQLRRRLEETEKAMERICRQMGNVTDKLSTSAVAELLAPHLSDKEMLEAESAAFLEQSSAVPVVEENQSLEHDNLKEVAEEAVREENLECETVVPEETVELAEVVEECKIEQTEECEPEEIVQEEVPSTVESAQPEEPLPVEECCTETSAPVVESVEQTEDVPTDLPEIHAVEDVEAQIEQAQSICESVQESVEEAAPETVEEVPETEEVVQEPAQEEVVQEPAQEEEIQITAEEIVVEEITEPEVVSELPEVEESNLQIEEPVEEIPEAVEPVIICVVEETVEEVPRPESVQEQEITPEEESLSAYNEETIRSDTESVQEPTISEEGEHSWQDGETIEEILESESVQEQTLAEDVESQQINEDIVGETLEMEVAESCPSEEIPTKIEDPVEEASEVVLEEIAIQTPCRNLQMEEASVRQGSEERRMTVNVCGMDVTAGMEDCGKMPSDLLPKITDKHHQQEPFDLEHVPSVFLDAAIPAESHLVVSEAECSAEIVPAEQLDLDEAEYETSPVVLSGKMTLSVIGMELNAEAPEIQEEPLYRVDESDTPRVRFPPQPTDRIFLIPVEPEEELIPEETELHHDEFRAEEEDEQVDGSAIVYRPPTPPLQHLVDPDVLPEDTEFLTYDQLEEVGEVEVPAEEVAPQEEICQQTIETIQEEPAESMPECPVQFDTTIYPSDEESQELSYTAACDPIEKVEETIEPIAEEVAQPAETADEFWSKDTEAELPTGVDQSLLDAVESHIISAEESEALTGIATTVADLSDQVEEVGSAIPANDEHAIIGEMLEKIRVATEESAPAEPAQLEETKLTTEEEISFLAETSGPEDIDINALESLINEPVEQLEEPQNLPVGQVVDEEAVYEMEDMAPEACSEFVSYKIDRLDESVEAEVPTEIENVITEVPEQIRSVQSALNEMVDTIITSSVAESLLREKCDTEVMEDVIEITEPEAESLEQSETLLQQLSERINLLPDSGAEKILMDVEYQIIPTSSESTSVTEVESGEQEISQEEVNNTEDFERNREEVEMEHALEQVEVSVTCPEELPEDVTEVKQAEEVEAEPSISGFTIREDFPDEEETQSMTEEEILQARQEIEEIKKLLADVSSGVVHQYTTSQTPSGSSNIVTELAYAMAEDAGAATATSKGSSPDMDEYEVIQTARPTDTSDAETADSSAPSAVTTTTSTSIDS